MLVLMSCFLSLPDHAPLAPYRLGSSVIVVRYGRLGSFVIVVRYGRLGSPVIVVRYSRTLRAVEEVVAMSRRNSNEIALALVA